MAHFKSPSPQLIETIIQAALAEDLGPSFTDITSELTVPADLSATAQIVARENGVLAGLIVGLSAFSLFDPTLEITVHAQDGDTIEAEQVLAEITGPARSLLSAERVALNIIGQLSGIASLTAQYVAEVSGTHSQIVDTRKTTPNFRALEKYAVQCGGGANHRFGLYDAIMIKDNHIAFAGGDIESILNKACLLKSHMTRLQIEVDTLDQLAKVLDHGGADAVLLDNMPPETLTQAVEMINRKLVTEASGGVTLDRVKAIAQTGVDYISVGALTHSAQCLDVGLDIHSN